MSTTGKFHGPEADEPEERYTSPGAQPPEEGLDVPTPHEAPPVDLPEEDDFDAAHPADLPGEDPFDAPDDEQGAREELESEATRIDTQNLIAEQTTDILEEEPEPPVLKVQTGKDTGREFILNPGETTLGRSIDNDAILTDIAASRRHLRVLREGDGLRLQDLGSGNGTLVNDKAVQEVPLYDGDRIQVGETVLLVHIPAYGSGAEAIAPAAREEAVDADTDETHSPDFDAQIPPPPRVPSETGAVQAGPATEHVAIRRKSKSPAWSLYAKVAAGVAFLTVVLTLLFYPKGPSEQELAADKHEALMKQGVHAYQTNQWQAAEQAFKEALNLRPEDQLAQDYLGRVSSALEHQQMLEQARQDFVQGQAAAAVRKVSAIPEKSPIHEEAQGLLEKARAQLVSGLIEEGRKALEGGELAAARVVYGRARTLSPSSEQVLALGEAIRKYVQEDETERPSRRSRRARRTTRRSRPTPAPRPRRTQSSSNTGEVLSLYRQGRFREAASEAEKLARGASGRSERKLQRLAADIERFAQHYTKVRRAGSNTASVLQPMKSAIRLDQSISGGHYAKRMRGQLAEAYEAAAKAAWDAGRSSTACRRVRQALELDGSSRVARQVSQQCERLASQMMRRASSLERSDPSKARASYREVLTLVPASSSLYQDAYKRLNRLARQQAVDEDE